MFWPWNFDLEIWPLIQVSDKELDEICDPQIHLDESEMDPLPYKGIKSAGNPSLRKIDIYLGWILGN